MTMEVTRNGEVLDDIPALSADGRREAEYRSRHCPHCGGSGLALVDATDPGAKARTVGATCVCVHGRWIRSWHDKFDRAILERIPDLAAILHGRDRRWRFDDELT